MIDYPLAAGVPEPIDFNQQVNSHYFQTLEMASGRKRATKTMPGVLNEGTLVWELLPREFYLFLGWWRWLCNNGIEPVQFDTTSDFSLNNGISTVLLKPNTFKEVEQDGTIQVTIDCYVTGEV